MIKSNILDQEKDDFNKLATHPLQSWEWGTFRKKTGVKVVRLGRYQKEKLVETAQITIHPIPHTSWTIGYFPKGTVPSAEMFDALAEIGKENKCIFIKLEPNIEVKDSILQIPDSKFHLVASSHSLFPKYTFQLDLTKNKEDLFKNFHSKTRYNIRLAQKKGVKVKIDNSKTSFQEYLKLLEETIKRQKFFAHNKKYHRLMWETLNPSGIAHLLKAFLKKDGKRHTLVCWVVFLFHNTLYYPYGASTTQYKNLMASNLIMWEAILFGQKKRATKFDMWGSLGKNPSKNDPWYGFHRFKAGYNPRLVEFVGSYDLIINKKLYRLYNITHILRQLFLKIKETFQTAF